MYNMSHNFLLFSPMEQFETFPIFSFSIILPNSSFYMVIAGLFSILIARLGGEGVGSKGIGLVPTNMGVTHESLFRTILLMVDSNMSTIYFPMIYTIFTVILFSNLVGLIPYSSTPTVEIILTLSLAFTVLVGVLILGFITHKLYLLAAFLPAGTPVALMVLMVFLEVMAYIIRIFSLGLRLGVNMITGHILVKVCISFIWVGYLNGTSIILLTIPMFLLTLYLALELLIAYLQAYIFTFITCITFNDLTK